MYLEASIEGFDSDSLGNVHMGVSRYHIQTARIFFDYIFSSHSLAAFFSVLFHYSLRHQKTNLFLATSIRAVIEVHHTGLKQMILHYDILYRMCVKSRTRVYFPS